MINLVIPIKLIVSIAIVLLMAYIAERINPKYAGIVSGMPTGTAITLFFIGLEINSNFAADTAIYNLMGIVAMQIFFFVYYKSCLKHGLIISSILSIAAYFLAIYFLHFLPASKWIAVMVSTLSIPLFIFLYKNVTNIKIKKRVKLTTGVLFLRAIVASIIIFTITGVAQFVGSTWSGLFTAFPVTVFPLFLIIHHSYGHKYIGTICKNIPLGQGSLILFSLTVYFTYPWYGIIKGTLFSFLMAAIYLALFFSIKSFFSKQLNRIIFSLNRWMKKY